MYALDFFDMLSIVYKTTINTQKTDLEFKGFYKAPKIEMRPHLILLPHTMSLTEMTLSIYRLVCLECFVTYY